MASRKPDPKRRPAPGAAQITAGAGPTVTTEDGAVYRLGWNSQDAKGRLESLVEDHVTLSAVRRKRRLGGEDGDEAFAAVQGRLDAGHYRTLAPGWRQVLGSPDGAVLFPLSLFQHHHPDMTVAECRELLEAEPEQCGAALSRVANDFFAAALLQVVRSRGVPADRAAAAVAEMMARDDVCAAIADLAAVGGPIPPTTPGPATG